MLSPCTGQVAHALLTRPPLRCPMIRPKLPRRAIPVRLACVKHAASVHPEPGSNSHFHLSLPVLTGFTVLFRLYLLLSLRKLYFGNFVSKLRFGSSASDTVLWILSDFPSLFRSGPSGIFRVALLFICQGSVFLFTACAAVFLSDATLLYYHASSLLSTAFYSFFHIFFSIPHRYYAVDFHISISSCYLSTAFSILFNNFCDKKESPE